MGRLAPIVWLIEFWAVLIAFVPAALAAAWFVFRRYLTAQNDVLLKYKPTIDTVSLAVAIGSLIVGYVNLKREIEKLRSEKSAVVPPATATKRYKTKHDGDVNLRPCAKPTNECAPIVVLPPGTNVEPLGDTRDYIDARGVRTTWLRVRASGHVGWVNQSVLGER